MPAWAQNPTASAAPYPTAPEQLRTVWHKDQDRRVLVAVLPTWIDGKYDAAKPLPKTVEQWLQDSKYVARSFGAITTVAPAQRAVVPKAFGAPDLFHAGNPWQDKINALPQLFASLSASQWRLIASPQGIAKSSLTAAQKELWELAVPKPFSFDRTNSSYYARKTPPENIRTLTDGEREQVRLRLKLIASADAQMATQQGRFPVIFHKNQYEHGRNGESYLHMRESGLYESPDKTDDSGVSSYGQTVLSYEPMRPKTVPEAFATKLTAAPVTLTERSTDKPLTAGELVDAVDAATGLKLYLGDAARRAPVLVVNSGSVAASDLLYAYLCATDSTVRILPPAQAGDQPLYVIAQNSEPEGRIEGRKDDWQSGTESTLHDMRIAANEQIKTKDPLSLLQFDADDPLPLKGELRERVFAAARKQANGRANVPGAWVSVTLSELPASAQKEINDRARELARTATSEGNYSVRVDKVEIDCSVWLGYIAPGSGPLSGEIDADPLEDLNSWLNDMDPAPVNLKGRILLVSAQTDAQAQELMRAAQVAQAKEVWLDAPLSVIAGAAGTAGNLPVRAVASLLRVGADTPDTLPRDENIFGLRSRDWLVPDDAAVIRNAAERVRALAEIPGIVGIVLRDAVPPGYRGSNESTEERVWSGESGPSYGGTGRPLGYTLTHRRRYVQESGSDPADIVAGLEADSPGSAWHAWARKSLSPLWAEVRTAAKDTPLFMEGESTFATLRHDYYDALETFVPWEAKDTEPQFVDLFCNTHGMTPGVSAKPPALVVITGNPNTDIAAGNLLLILKREDKPETTIWDLSDKRVPGVTEQLRALKREVKAP